MARYTITAHVDAPSEHVFALVVHFGPMKSPMEILEVERPRLFSTRFGKIAEREAPDG